MATDFAKLRQQLAQQRKAQQSSTETEPTGDEPSKTTAEVRTENAEAHSSEPAEDAIKGEAATNEAPAASVASKLAQRLARQKASESTPSKDDGEPPTELDESHFAGEPEESFASEPEESAAMEPRDSSAEEESNGNPSDETELAPNAFAALLLQDEDELESESMSSERDFHDEGSPAKPAYADPPSPLARRNSAVQKLRPKLTPEPELPKAVEQSENAAKTLRATKSRGKKKKAKPKKQAQKLLAAPVTTTVTVDSTGNSRELATPEVKKKRERKIGSSKMSPAELRFYENLGLDASSRTLYEDAVILLRPPIGVEESPSARAKRQSRVSAALDRRAEGGVQYRLLQRDREVLEFLAAFRYAPAKTLCAMFAEAEATAYRRLRRLRAMGLVNSERLYGLDRIWYLTQAGMVMSGFDLSRFTRSKLTFTMIPPQLVVNHLAANLWGATINVIEDDEFPRYNRPDYTTAGQRENGGMGPGELVVSELEIQSSLSRVRGFDKADVYKPQIVALIEAEFKKWRSLPADERGPSPEQLFGHEFMWALYPPALERKAHHVPDLVVKRPRRADGSPASVAIEVELSNKSEKEYERTLRTYRADKLIYDKVVWVCHTIGPARKLERVAKELGLWQEGRIQIVPILTKDGVFRDRDPWTL